ncbi:hypothetical protein Misp01_11920 [Microtetraspora sp. NBRC 13810]|uniref:hypothetical protein n=1 Tax=Microtetraspora sp. NBRC 13810 TaxID=3030990 RepID=UPI0024A4A319|nr:hypothetical protein [Microtetraspora sp. NBRC 13810]GLW06062.1 hypothetical protein Misp01_11920 [Microtetraspora sp. NBRC 13810]
MNEAGAAIGKLRVELAALGVADAYEIGDDATLSVWVGLVVCYRDGCYRWREGAVRRSHLGNDPVGCALRVARRYAEVRADVPPWWEDLARILRGDVSDRR